MFSDVMELLWRVAKWEFDAAASVLIEYVDQADDFLELLSQIGTIPEELEPDSTEEKLFSKLSDAVLARAFREIGLKAMVLKERSDSADVFAESPIHGYKLVADAKAFRLSRTAKNQKDFKVVALSNWRQDADFAVLCCPYFQYPAKSSQIYGQALEHNVCLLSWEHLLFLIEHHIKEDEACSFATIWGYGAASAGQKVLPKKQRCFIPLFTRELLAKVSFSEEDFADTIQAQIKKIADRAIIENRYWKTEIDTIYTFTREQAIEELIKARKIQEKLTQINSYIERLKN